MNKKLKVIQLIDSLNAGGAEMMAVNIANELAYEDEIESYLCATRLEGNLKEKVNPAVHYLFLNKKSSIDFRAIKKLYAYLNLHQITTIHAHSSSYFMGFLMKLLNPKLKLIWHDHYGKSDYTQSRSRFPLAYISKYFQTVIAVNSKLLAWDKKELKAYNYLYLPNFAVLNPLEAKSTFLKGVSEKRMVCLANLRPQKDHINLLNAFKIVHEKCTDWTLHLVGLDLKDKYASEIKEYITFNKLGNHVFLYGSCSDTAHILEQASIGVLASKSEGLPVALLEYGLAKLSVVVTDVGECASVIAHEKSGLVVEPNNEVAFANALETLVLDEKLRTKLGAALYETVQMKYSKSNFIHTLIAIYNLD